MSGVRTTARAGSRPGAPSRRGARTLLALGVGAAVALAGCSAEEETTTLVTSAPSSSTAATAPSASASADGAGGGADAVAFCSRLQTTFSGVSETMATAQGNDLGPALTDVVAAFDAVEPPAEIADAMATLRGDYAALAEAAGGVDLTTEEGQSSFAATYQTISTEAGTAQADVQAWLTANCPAPSATPSAAAS